MNFGYASLLYLFRKKRWIKSICLKTSFLAGCFGSVVVLVWFSELHLSSKVWFNEELCAFILWRKEKLSVCERTAWGRGRSPC